MAGVSGLVALLVMAGILLVLLLTRLSPAMAFAGGLSLLVLLQVAPSSVAFSGFANPALVTIAALLIVAEGLRQTGAIELLSLRVFGAPRTAAAARWRILPLAAVLSSIMNNTPVVAVFVPMITGWARRFRYPASRVLLPMVFAVSLGGLCTLVGTSTNLLVAGMALEKGLKLHLLSPAAVGVPLLLVGLVYLTILAPKMLPSRWGLPENFGNPREYSVEMQLQAGSPLVGKTVEEAGLRHLVGVYLAEIQREGKVLPAVPPTEVLLANDRLVFVGAVESIVDLQRVPGLVPATDQLFKLDVPRHERQVVEMVVTDAFPLIGRTVREARFRTEYNAVIVAVSRQGRRLSGKVGDIRLEAGDTLLLEAPPGFVDRYRFSREFFLLTEIPGSNLLQHSKAPLALVILGVMLAAVATGLCSLLEGSLGAAGLILAFGCLPWQRAWQAIDWPLLVTLGSAIGVGQVLQESGAAMSLAQAMTKLAGCDPFSNMVAVFFATAILTQLITNNAAAALIFPVAAAVAQGTGASLTPFAIAVMVASSSAFLTPWGYQTNLLVQGPGNYRLWDYLRVGGPLLFFVTLVSCWWIPKIWPF